MRSLILFALILAGCSDAGLELMLQDTGEVILSDEDIISYNWTSHEVAITPAAVGRLRAMMPSQAIDGQQVPYLGGLAGEEFELRIDGEAIYTGAMWSRVMSRTYEGVVINDMLLLNGTLEIDPWYPEFQARGEDSRDDPRVREHFERQGKLVR